MAKRKQWQGPFEYKTDGTCVKCDKRQEYFVNVGGMTLGACREHAIEAACSREGGRTIAEATLELDDIDRESWRQRNTFTASWIPVAERLPDDRQNVIAFFPSPLEFMTHAVYEKDLGWFSIANYGAAQASHWMPFPAPPADAK